MLSFVYGSDEYYKRYSLPESAFKPNNASAIFGGQCSLGIGPAGASIFRPTKPPPVKPAQKERKKVTRSKSDVVIRRAAVEKRKAKEVVPRRTKNHLLENGAISPRSSISNEGETHEDPDLTDSGELNGDRYPLFIAVNEKTQVEVKQRKSSKSPSPPTNRAANGESPKKSPGTQGQRSSRAAVRRSASFSSSTPRRISESESTQAKPTVVVRPRVVGNSPSSRAPVDSLRREKSDVVSIRGKRTVSPASPRRENSDLKSKSPSALRREKSDITFKRPQSPGGFKRENSDLVRPRGSSSPLVIRREKSDLVSPRIHLGKRETSDVSRPRTKAQATQNISTNNHIKGNRCETSANRVIKSTSQKNLRERSASPNRTNPSPNRTSSSPNRTNSPTGYHQEQAHHIQHSTDMSKIPTPQSRIPSLSKHGASHEHNRAPPKSKIPSLGKGDKKGPKEAEKKSHIPAPGSISKEKPASKIPGAPGRPDSAKENKDPTLVQNDIIDDTHKTNKQDAKPASRIPSFSKAGSKSKIPSMSRQDSHGKSSVSSGEHYSDSHGKSSVSSGEHNSDENLANDDPEPIVNGNHKPAGINSKIPSLASPHAHQTSGIPTSGSKIPSISRGNAAPKHDKPVDKVDSTPPSSKIPHIGGSTPVSSTTHKTGIPAFSSPVASKEPVVNGVGKTTEAKSRIPSVSSPHQNSGIPVAPKSEEKTEHKPEVHVSKIPSFGGTPKSRIPSVSASRLPRKPSEDEKPAVPDNEAETPTEIPAAPVKETSTPAAKVAPPPPPRKDVEKQENTANQSPMEKYIFSEAKKMEKLLRDEDIVVEVPADEVKKEEIKTDYELRQAEVCRFEKAQEAEDLISEVLKSYAPDLPTYSSDRSLDLLSNDRTPEHRPKLTPVKTPTVEKAEDEKKAKAKEEEVVFQTFGKRNTPPTVKLTTHDESKSSAKTDPKKDISLHLPGLNEPNKERADKKDVAAPVVKATGVQSPPVSSPETPAIDTLGQYEQQARRSRSRQRKVITPDAEEPPKTFGDESAKDASSADVEKSKFGKSPFDTEPAKDTKPVAAKPVKSKSKHEFVIESSLGKDFYASKRPDDSASKENLQDDLPKPEMIVIQNKTFEEKNPAPKVKPTGKAKVESTAFEDVELSSHKGSKQEMRAWSMDELDEKTVKCSCGRGGKCAIM